MIILVHATFSPHSMLPGMFSVVWYIELIARPLDKTYTYAIM